MTTSGALARRLGTGRATVIGLSAMIGAGVFAVFGPASRAAGSGLLLGLALAAVVATANATSTAQLAAAYPTSGGTYVYGRRRLGPWWGYTAGWAFVVGKTASCAAMATTFAAYVLPGPWQRPVAATAVVAVTALGLRGVTRTAQVATVLVSFVLAALVAVLASVLAGAADPAGLTASWSATGGAAGVLQSAGLIFFAFAGYARVATLGEEVVAPRRTIPRAVVASLAVAAALYAAVALVLLHVLGPQDLAASAAPLADVAARGPAWAVPLVRAAAVVAALGALLSLLAGVSRTTLAMARTGDLPRPLAAVHQRTRVPYRAELAVGAVITAAVLVADLRELIGFSSVGVLLYYAVANLAALTQEDTDRRYPRVLQVTGLVGCLVLVVTLPAASVVAGLAVVAVGLVLRAVRPRRAAPGSAER